MSNAFTTIHVGQGYTDCSAHTGTPRSMNSERAIGEFEVPMGLITKATLSAFFESAAGKHILENNAEFASTLRSLSVSEWRAAAKRMGRTSRHHTGAKFAETSHYDLNLVAIVICDELDLMKVPESRKAARRFSDAVLAALKDKGPSAEFLAQLACMNVPAKAEVKIEASWELSASKSEESELAFAA